MTTAREELQARERQCREAELKHKARAHMAADLISASATELYEYGQAQYYRGKADGIREALKMWAEREL